MKTITVPAPIDIVFLDGTPAPKGDLNPMSFWQFAFDRLADIQGADLDALIQAIKIKKILTTGRDENSTSLVLETADWKALRDKAVKPSAPYNTNVAHCLVPFIEALSKAEGE